MCKVLRISLVLALILAISTGCSSKTRSEVKSSPTPFAIPAEPKTLEDLIANPSSATYWAWKKSADKVKSSVAIADKVEILIGPNTVPDNKSPEPAFDLASKLYSDFKHNQKVTLVYYQYEDIDWAQGKIKDFLGTYQQDWQKTQASNSCKTYRDCMGAVAMTHPTKQAAIILVTASEFGKADVNHTSGSVEAHEYTHVIQDILQGKFLGKLPRWHVEGEAEFSQAASIYYSDYQKYLAERSRITSELIKNPEITEDWLIDFLSPKTGLTNWQSWDKYYNWRLYDVGMLVTELLASLKGPESTMMLSAEVGEGISYKDAFNKIYGISWQEAVPLMAKIISKEINS